MKTFTLTFLLVTALSTSIAQTVISAFDWDTAPKTATIGPNATSSSASATVGTPAVSGKAINPGLPKKDIDLVLPGATFNVDGVSVSIQFKRKESTANFIDRGSNLVIGMNGGKLFLKYRIDDLGGGFTQVSASNIVAVANDNKFHAYSFVYKPSTGVAELQVDGIAVWNNPSATPGQVMYWTGAGDLKIGTKADANGANTPIFDDFSFAEFTYTPLPVTLVNFEATASAANTASLKWSTASEQNNDFFTVERSYDGAQFEPVQELAGAGTTSVLHSYEAHDVQAVAGTVYYRLKQTDFDGTTSFSKVVAVALEATTGPDPIFTVYPNPCSGSCTVALGNSSESLEVAVYDLSGQQVQASIVTTQSDLATSYQLTTPQDLSPGTYLVRAESAGNLYATTIVVQ